VALNFLGLGFSFGAKDMGLEKVQQQITAGFQGINQEIGSLHETTKPAFNYVGEAMDGVDAVLARQQVRVREWSRSFAESIDNVAAMPKKVTSAFDPLTSKIKEGAQSTARVWDETFGKSFSAVGQKFEGLKWRISSIVQEAEPLTSKFRGIFKKSAEGSQLFSGALSGILDKFRGLGDDTEESEGIVKKFTFFFQKRAGEIRTAQQKIGEGFDSIKGVVASLNKILQVNKLRGFMEAISVGMLGKISSGIRKIGMEGLNLTAGLEGQMAGLAKSSRQATVQLGLTGKEARAVAGQASGMALGLNIGAETATQAIVGWKKSMNEMRMVGIQSASDMAKVSEVLGVNAQQFSFMLKGMTKMGLGEKEIQKITSTFTKMGQTTQDVSGALGSLPEMMKILQKQMAIVGGDKDPARMAEFAKQTATLAAGFGALGHSADEARSLALGLSGSLVEAQDAFQGMYAGLEGDLPGLAKELMLSGVRVDKSFAMMQEGPEGFMKGLLMLREDAKKSGKDISGVMAFMRKRLQNSGIAGIDELTNFLAKADDEVFKTMKDVSEATEKVGDLGKEGFSTGRTLQESFDLAKESMVTSFRAIGGARQKFVRDSVKEFGKLTQTMKGLAEKGGPMGKMVELMSDMHSIGALALIPESLRPLAAVLAEVLAQMGPIIGALGGALVFFPKWTMALGPLVAIISFFSLKLLDARMQTKSWAEAFDKAAKDIEKTLANLSKKVVEWLDKIFVKGPKKAQNTFLKGLAGFGKRVFKALVTSIGEITGKLAEMAKEIDWAAFFTGIVQSIGKATKALGKVAVGILRAIADGFSGAAKDPGTIGKIISDLLSIFVEVAKGLGKAMMSVDWGNVVSQIFSALVSFFEKGNEFLRQIPWETIMNKVFDGLLAVVNTLASPKMQEMIQRLVKALVDRAVMIGKALVTLFVAALDFLAKVDWSGLLTTIIGALVTVIEKVVTFLAEMDWGKIITAFVNAFTTILPKLIDALIKVVSMIGERLPDILQKLVPALVNMVQALLRALPTILPKILPAITKLFKELTPVILTLASDLLGAFIMLAVELLKDPKLLTDAFKTLFLAPFQIAWAIVQGLFEGIGDWLVEAFPEVFEGLADAWEWLTDITDKLFKGIKIIFDTVVVKPITLGLKLLKKAFEVVFKFLKQQWKAVSTAASNAWKAIKQTWDDAKRAMEGIFKGIADAGKKIWDDIVNSAKNVWTRIQEAWGDVKKFFADLFSGVLDTIKEPLGNVRDFVVGIWDDGQGGGIKGAWGKAEEFFRTMWGKIGQIMETIWGKIKEKVEAALGPMKWLFEKLDKWIEKLFGHSIDSDVERSMSASAEYTETYSLAMVKAWKTAMDFFVNNTEESFKSIEHSTKSFLADELEQFKGFLNDLKMAFNSAFSEMRNISDRMTESLTNAVADVTRQMNQIADGFRAVAAAYASAQVSREKLERDDEEAKREEKLAKRLGTKPFSHLSPEGKTLAAAIHHPDWWKVAEKQLAALHAATVTTNSKLDIVDKSIRNIKLAPAQAGGGRKGASPAGAAPSAGTRRSR
jgi:phage-related protein